MSDNVMYKGVVVRQKAVGESAALITVLTENDGIIVVLAQGGRNVKSSYHRSVQLFAYSELYVTESEKGKILTEAVLLESFFLLGEDVYSLAFACYAAEVCSTMSIVGESEPLQLLLNTLYATTKKLLPLSLIKAVFETRTAHINGFEPIVSECIACGSEDVGGKAVISIENGGILCTECAKDIEKTELSFYPLTDIVFKALTYVLSAEPKKIFAFRLDDESIKEYGAFAEKYMMFHMNIRFKSLDYYNGLISEV